MPVLGSSSSSRSSSSSDTLEKRLMAVEASLQEQRKFAQALQIEVLALRSEGKALRLCLEQSGFWKLSGAKGMLMNGVFAKTCHFLAREDLRHVAVAGPLLSRNVYRFRMEFEKNHDIVREFSPSATNDISVLELKGSLRQEIKTVFRDFLHEVREVATGKAPESRSLHDDSPFKLYSNVSQCVDFIARLCQCHEEVRRELSGDEAILWDRFFNEDTHLLGTLDVRSQSLQNVLKSFAHSEAQLDRWVASIRDLAKPSTAVTFMCLLDFWEQCGERNEAMKQLTKMKTMLQLGLIHTVEMSPDGKFARKLEERAKSKTTEKEQKTTLHIYEQMLVQICSRKTENKLSNALSSLGRKALLPDLLTAVLKCIHDTLSPAERALWKIFAAYDANFDGGYTQSEVQKAVNHILEIIQAAELEDKEDNANGEQDAKELFELRVDITKDYVDELFSVPSAFRREGVVSFADVLQWWWDMDDEFRAASGLCVTTSRLQASCRSDATDWCSIRTNELTKNGLELLQDALRGHSRLIAELRIRTLRNTFRQMFEGGSDSDSDEMEALVLTPEEARAFKMEIPASP